MPIDKEDREYYREAHERESVERARRDDLEFERGFWSNVVEIRIQDGGNIAMALADADKVLEAYRSRFQ